MQGTHWTAAFAALIAAAGVGGGVTLTPLKQERMTGSFVIVPPCAPELASDSEDATDFGPFVSSVGAIIVCDVAQGEAFATQDSSIESSSLVAEGTTDALAVAAMQTVIHAIPNSFYEVTFELSDPAQASIDALLTAEGEAPVVLCAAQVRLKILDGATFFDHVIEPFPDGAKNSFELHTTVRLVPATYVFRSAATSAIDSTIPPNGSGAASFEAALRLFDPGDLDQDGAVDGSDLGILLAAWGDCFECNDCPADIDGDCAVDGSDLGILLGDWSD
jgi:hypothetical protein